MLSLARSQCYRPGTQPVSRPVGRDGYLTYSLLAVAARLRRSSATACTGRLRQPPVHSLGDARAGDRPLLVPLVSHSLTQQRLGRPIGWLARALRVPYDRSRQYSSGCTHSALPTAEYAEYWLATALTTPSTAPNRAERLRVSAAIKGSTHVGVPSLYYSGALRPRRASQSASLHSSRVLALLAV